MIAECELGYLCTCGKMSDAVAACSHYRFRPDRDPLLVEREKTHGSFQKQGAFAYDLKRIFRNEDGYKHLRDDQKEALDMIATKISRVLHGNPMTKDTWNDIAGYAKLGAEACDA